MGDLFLANAIPALRPPLVFGAGGTPRSETVGVQMRACAVDVNISGGFDGGTLSRVDDLHNALGQHEVIQSVILRSAI